MQNNECIICYEEINLDNKQILSCGHYYHKECLYKWSINENSCPECRKVFEFETNSKDDFIDWLDKKLHNFNNRYEKYDKIIHLIEIVNALLLHAKKDITCSVNIYIITLQKLKNVRNVFYEESWYKWVLYIIGLYKNVWYENAVHELEKLIKEMNSKRKK